MHWLLAAASSATGGRWPGCAAPRSQPTPSGRSRRPSAARERSSACVLPGCRTSLWPPDSPGSPGDNRVADLAGLPDKRWSVRGLTEEGDEAWVIRGISRKLYRCPSCHGEIEIGSEHVIVQYVFRLGGTEHHHWHRRCAEELLIPDLHEARRVPAGESAQSKLEERGRYPSGRRRHR